MTLIKNIAAPDGNLEIFYELSPGVPYKQVPV
jgi:hypothetical protein